LLMKLTVKLNTRMLLYIISTTVLIFAAGIGYISFRYQYKALNDAKEMAILSARESANHIKSLMDADFGFSRGMAQSHLAIEDRAGSKREELQFDILKKILEQNPSYIASFLQWDLSDCDPTYHKDHGRRRALCFRKYPNPDRTRLLSPEDYGPIDTMFGYVDTSDFDYNNPYYVVKRELREFIIDPYFYSYQTVKEMPSEVPTQVDAILETTIIVPIISDGKFRALTGVDIPLNHFQEIIDKIKPFKESKAFIVSNNGKLVAHPEKKFIREKLAKVITKGLPVDFDNRIKRGVEFSMVFSDSIRGEIFYVFSPIVMGRTGTPWSVGIEVPVAIIMADADRHFQQSLFAGLLGLILLSLVIWRISVSITRPIEETTQVLTEISLGKITQSKKLAIKTRDEIGQMADSVNILIDGFKQTASYAKKIGEGNLDTDYKMLSEHDELGISLVDMRAKLKASRAEIEAKNQELEKLSMVAEQTDNAVMIMDKSGRFEWVNSAFEKMYGYTLADFAFGNDNIINLSSNPDIKTIINTCNRRHETIFYESMIYSKSREPIYAQTTITPVLSESGDVVKLIAIDSNISPIKKAQSEIERQRNELELLNATKDKFFAIIAHDLKNPFTSLLSLSQSVSEQFKELEPEELEQFLNRVNKSAWQIYKLLENLLTWSRSQTGKIEFNPEQIHLNQLVEETVALLEDTAIKKNISLSSVRNSTETVFADRNMLLIIVRNLVHNSIKFTDQGGNVSIKVNRGEDKTTVIVEDTGIGISSEDQHKLFRIDVKTKAIGSSKEKGTGLGLILCKEFIEKNGGSISVESEAGKGSRFIFTVPNN